MNRDLRPVGLFAHVGYRATAWCRNPACDRVRLDGDAPNGVAVDLAALDPSMTRHELETRLACSLCGSRDVRLRLDRPATTYAAVFDAEWYQAPRLRSRLEARRRAGTGSAASSRRRGKP